MKGEHDSDCVKQYPACLCNTCQRDPGDSDGIYACCEEHEEVVGSSCPVTACPDYLKEEETSNADT